MDLKNPIVPSSSPLSENLDNVRRLEDAGAAAIVMYSLFEEQINHEARLQEQHQSYGSDSNAEGLNYFPRMETFKVGPDEYLDRIVKWKQATEIPIIGSLNGSSAGGWTEYANKIAQAGADALELNIYHVPTDPGMTGTEVESMYLDVVEEIKKSISIPVAVKIGPFVTNTAHFAQSLADRGADALVLFNRFYQPDFDLESLTVAPNLILSTSYEMLLPLRWVAIMYGRVDVEFAITSGVHTHEDVLKGLMAGANVTMMASELLQNGIERITEVLSDMTEWMETHEYESVSQMQGSMSQQHTSNPTAFERANYMKVIQSWNPDPTGRMM